MIPDKLYERLLSIPKEPMLRLMLSALDDMNGYNGQSMTEAIMRAVGSEKTEKGWKLPSKKKILEIWGDS